MDRMTPVSYFNSGIKNKSIENKGIPYGVSTMKKSWKYENEVQKCQTMVPHLPTEYGDRFIPRRYQHICHSHGQQLSSQSNLNRMEENVDLFRLKATPGYWRLHSHRYNIENSLGIDDAQKVLCMHDWLTKAMCQRSLNNMPYVCGVASPSRNAGGLDWPCRPRPVPLAYNDSTHDLPEFHQYSSYNIIAWSSLGKIAASFGRDLVLWGPQTAQARAKITTVYRVGLIRSLAFSSCGRMLALGIDEAIHCRLQIYFLVEETSTLKYDKIKHKQNLSEIGHYMFKKQGLNNIRAIEWDSKLEHILCGMQTGQLHKICLPKQLRPSSSKLAKLREDAVCTHHADNCISYIKYSLRRTYIATVDFSGKLSIRFRKQFNQIYHCIEDTDFFVWHPWNETDLFIGKCIILSSSSTSFFFSSQNNNRCLFFFSLSLSFRFSFVFASVDQCVRCDNENGIGLLSTIGHWMLHRRIGY